MGGEWEPKELTMWAHYARKKQLKTALYTGRELGELPQALKAELNIIKTGPWRMELGGLNSPNTNQQIHYNREVSICL